MPRQPGKQDPIPTPEEQAAADSEVAQIEATEVVNADLFDCNQLQMRYDYPHLFPTEGE